MTKDARPIPRVGFNRSEVAIAIGVSTNTVDRMVEEGFLPRPRIWHTRKIWIVAEVQAAMLEWPVDGPPVDDGDNWRASV